MSDFGGGAPPPPPPPSAGGGGPIPQRGLGDILSTAFELYKANFAKLIQLVAIVVVPLALVQAFVRTVAFKPCEPRDINTLEDLNDLVNDCAASSFGRSLLVAAIIGLLTVAIQQLLVGALTRGGAGALLGRAVDVNASYKYAFSRLGGLVGIGAPDRDRRRGRVPAADHPRPDLRGLPVDGDPRVHRRTQGGHGVDVPLVESGLGRVVAHVRRDRS